MQCSFSAIQAHNIRCGLVHYLSLICAVSFLLSTLSFSITKKFSNGLEIKFDMKMEDLVMCSALSVIGVLGMVPTGCAVRGSRRLKGEKRITVRII